MRKSGSEAAPEVRDTLLVEDAERDLAAVIARLEPEVAARMAVHDYGEALSLLAQARDSVDRYFDSVMVMVDDAAVRANRLAMLARLHRLMNGVADLSRLSVG